MGTWEKVIVSGSDAQVLDLEIQTPSSGPDNTLVIDDGQVDFGVSLPGLDSSETLAEGNIMIGDVNPEWGGTGRNLWVKNGESAFTGADLVIPANGQPADFNNDGLVTTADLLLFLSNFSLTGADLLGDINGDDSVNVADLLLFLTAFGGPETEFDYGSETDDDSRPFIDWGDSAYGFQQYDASGEPTGSGGYVTTQSVTDRHNALGTSAFFAMLPNTGDVDVNVSAYMTQMEGLSGPDFEVFKYIYFTQNNTPLTDEILADTNNDGTSVLTTITGGSDLFNRAGVAGLDYWESLGAATSPNGYGPYE